MLLALSTVSLGLEVVKLAARPSEHAHSRLETSERGEEQRPPLR